MDKFVERAFKDAINTELGVDDEFYKKFSEMAKNRWDDIMDAAGDTAGMERMEALSAVLYMTNLQDAFAKFFHIVSLLSFYEGYKARIEEENK